MSDDRLTALIAGYQDALVDAINDPKHFREERDGLRIAAALFRNELKRLGIPNVQPNWYMRVHPTTALEFIIEH